MSRLAALLLPLVTSSCMLLDDAVEPETDPTLAIFHGQALVTHSGSPSDGAVRLTCASGIERRGQVFAIDHGYPAPFAASIVGDFEPTAMQVIVFGGTIADTGPQTRISGDVISGQHVEVATLVLENEESRPVLDFSIIPMSLMGGAGTVMIEAAAVDAYGRELRTGYPTVGTAQSLCGPA